VLNYESFGFGWTTGKNRGEKREQSFSWSTDPQSFVPQKKQFWEPVASQMKKIRALKYRPSPNHPSEEKVLTAMAFNNKITLFRRRVVWIRCARQPTDRLTDRRIAASAAALLGLSKSSIPVGYGLVRPAQKEKCAWQMTVRTNIVLIVGSTLAQWDFEQPCMAVERGYL
jgi:hypothetical protein